MITEIKIRNFKSIKRADIKLNSLNIFTGLNGVGKTSFLQPLLLIMQSDKLEKGIIDLNGTLTEIGTGRDVLYQFAQKENIVFEIKTNIDNFIFDCEYNQNKDILLMKNKCEANQMTNIQNMTENFHYINNIRLGPLDIYPTASVVSEKKQIGVMGEYAPYYIHLFGNEYIVPEKMRHPNATSKTLLSQINAWMKEISPGVSLTTGTIPSVNKATLHYQFTYGNNKTNYYLPKNVGSGISYVIPVILMLLSASEGKTIIIENPESHIHPRGQAEIGKLISLAAQTGAQVFIETHSDHIINGIRVAVKEKYIDKEKVNILFFDRVTTETEQYAKITPIAIDKNGVLSEYPDNFMDEWSNQLSKLI